MYCATTLDATKQPIRIKVLWLKVREVWCLFISCCVAELWQYGKIILIYY